MTLYEFILEFSTVANRKVYKIKQREQDHVNTVKSLCFIYYVYANHNPVLRSPVDRTNMSHFREALLTVQGNVEMWLSRIDSGTRNGSSPEGEGERGILTESTAKNLLAKKMRVLQVISIIKLLQGM